jgi:hypothetical protein
LLVKLPVVVPSVECEPVIEGFVVVPQQIPLTVIKVPPLEVIVPPETAVVKVIEVTAVVVRVGRVAVVANERSFPYAVPALLVAYARTWYVVPADNPVRLLVKVPVPVPSVVLESVMVGFAAVAQQVPLAVIVPPPSEMIFPPETAVVKVIEETTVVVRVATTIRVVVNVTSFPYAVPTLLVA